MRLGACQEIWSRNDVLDNANFNNQHAISDDREEQQVSMGVNKIQFANGALTGILMV